jgi:hypothetical protein
MVCDKKRGQLKSVCQFASSLLRNAAQNYKLKYKEKIKFSLLKPLRE